MTLQTVEKDIKGSNTLPEALTNLNKIIQEAKQRFENKEGMSKEEFKKGILELKSIREKLENELKNQKWKIKNNWIKRTNYYF